MSYAKKLAAFAVATCLSTISFAQIAGHDQSESGFSLSRPVKQSEARSGEEDNPTLRYQASRARRGTNPAFSARMLKEAQRQRSISGANGSGPQWVNIGPTKTNHIQNGVLLTSVNSGRLRSILPHPTNPDILYVLTASGGLWKTTNYTANKPTWKAVTDTLATTSGGAAAFGRDANTIYLGLGDPYDGNGTKGGIMMVSRDAGATWSNPVQLPGVWSVQDIKVDTTGDQESVLAASDLGLFRSTDGGISYAKVADGSFWSIAQTSAGLVAAREVGMFGGTGVLYLSTDHGKSWKAQSGNGFPATAAGRTTLGVGKAGDNIVYAFAATQYDTHQLDLFRSTDGGLTWKALGITNKAPVNPNPYQPNLELMGGQAWYGQMILVDPTDAARNTVYLGGIYSTAKTTDGGNSFRIVSSWLGLSKLPYVHADFHASAFSLIGGVPTVFIGTDGGLFASSDGGNTFTDSKNEGIVSTMFYSIAGTPSKPDWAIMGAQDNGTYSRTVAGTVWNQTFGGDGFGTAFSQANTGIALGSLYYSRPYRSTNNPPNVQSKWTYALNGIWWWWGNFYTAIATPSAAVDPAGKTFFTYTALQIYKTTDGASSWTDIGHSATPEVTEDGVTYNPAVDASTGISPTRVFRDTPHGIGVSPAKGTTSDPLSNGTNHVAVVCNGGYVVVTHDNGATWTERGLISLIPGWVGFNSNVEFADNNTLYVASESPISAKRVAKSIDGGQTWSDSSNGLPDVPVQRILVSPTNKNTLYAGTFLGVYRSTDAGATWSRFGSNLPFVEVDDLYMPTNGSFLRIASYGRGAWEVKP